MADYLMEFEKWLCFEGLDTELRAELESIKNDEKEIKERFFAPLSFGTAGLRGIIRAGINGMNIYTVAQATQGLAKLVIQNGGQDKGVVIATDTRIKYDEFSKVCASVLAANGIKTYLFDAPRPTPELSFALRFMGAIAGINITASHNPKIYNGYKAYWSDGAQISPEQAKVVSDAIDSVDIFTGIKYMDFDKAKNDGLVEIIGKEIDEAFMDVVLKERIYPDAIKDVADNFKVVYTPFHGTGANLVPEVLKRAGVKSIFCAPEQMIPDGSFPTVKSPNPEDKEGFTRAIEIAKRENCNLIIGTDPDADRVGVVIKTNDGEFVCLTGNQIGVMLVNYIIEARRLSGNLPENACVIKSIVSTRLADAVCKENGVKIMDVLTGFKFIGEKMTEFEKTKEYTYIFGFEESYGYLSGTYARDKDAVCASLLITEMAAFYAKKGLTLYDVLMSIFEKYGYFIEGVENIAFPGADGSEKMKNLMNNLRENAPKEIAQIKVVSFGDYKKGEICDCNGKIFKTGLPKSDVLCYTLENGDVIFIRPSGTEPKIKVYYLASDKTKSLTEQKIENYKQHFKAFFAL